MSKTTRRAIERGNAGLFFGLGMILMLIAFGGYLNDVRRVALAQVRAQNTLDLAAHRASSNIDVNFFKIEQDVILSPGAQNVAVTAIQTAPQNGYSLSISSVRTLYGGSLMEIRGDMRVPLGFLGRIIGIPEAKRRFLTIVEPAYGIQQKYD
jgi:hypothetical protein